MPYRTAASVRKTMKLNLELTPKEIRKAIIDFLYESGMIPEGVEDKSINITTEGRYGPNGVGWKNSCKVEFECEVLTSADS